MGTKFVQKTARSIWTGPGPGTFDSSRCESYRTVMRCSVRFAALLTLLVLTSSAHAQFGAIMQPRDATGGAKRAYLDVSIDAANYLRTARSYVKDGNWAQAVSMYQKVIEDYGDKVIRLATGPDCDVYVSVRTYCHMQIQALPRDGLEQYRRLVDARAGQWFETGRDQHEPSLLRRVLDEAFCSSWGDEAADMLAELAFEQGRFEQAYRLWSMIYPPEGDNNRQMFRLVYPDPDVDKALICAKKLLALRFAGRAEEAAKEFKLLAKQVGNDKVRIGGARITFEELAKQWENLFYAKEPDAEQDGWFTFGGDASRGKIARALSIGGVQWSTELPSELTRATSLGPQVLTPAANRVDRLSVHPVIARGLVLVSGWNEVQAFDLHRGPIDGKPLWTYSLWSGRQGLRTLAPRWQVGFPAYTLTASGSKLYVRMGPPQSVYSPTRPLRSFSYIVCLDLDAEGKELWRVAPDDESLTFEGTPIADGENLYVALTRAGAMTYTYVACYDARSGRQKWKRLVCEASASATYRLISSSHHLLTLGSGLVFYNTNLGAIAALEAETGRIKWIFTYPRKLAAPTRLMGYQGTWPINPCVYKNGVVAAAPADARDVFIIDAQTGTLLAKVPAQPSIRDLLGINNGRLFATTDRAVLAVDVATGKLVWQWPSGPGRGLRAYGRGMLADKYVLFPAHSTDRGGEIFILDQQSGLPAKPSVELTQAYGQLPGNLAAGQGYLVVAHPRGLTVFCEHEAIIKQYQEQLARSPNDALLHYRLAKTAELADKFELAERHYRLAARLAKPNQEIDNTHLKELALSDLFQLLMKMAREATKKGKWAEADQAYERAKQLPLEENQLIQVSLKQGEVWEQAGKVNRALEIYQNMLLRHRMLGQMVPVGNNRKVRADVAVATRIIRLIAKYGRDAYAKYDRKAEELFAKAKKAGNEPLVEELFKLYPAARVAPEAALLAAQLCMNKKDWAGAARWFDRVSRIEWSTRDQICEALAGLARVHEARGNFANAFQLWQQLKELYPTLEMPGHPGKSVAEWVSEYLESRPTWSGRHAEAARPFKRAWQRRWDSPLRVVVPEGEMPLARPQPLLVSTGGMIEFIDLDTGQTIRSIHVGFDPTWAGRHRDKLILAGGNRLLCLDVGTGELCWSHAATTEVQARGAAERDEGIAWAEEIGDAKIIDDRLYMREGTEAVACFAIEDGRILWRYAPRVGYIRPHAYFSPRWAVISLDQPPRLVVLDRQGEKRLEIKLSSPLPAVPPAPIGSNALCLAVDNRTIRAIDLSSGSTNWSVSFRSSAMEVRPISAGRVLIALIDGTELVQIDKTTGRQLWSAPLSAHPLGRTGGAWAVNETRFYCITPTSSNLRAFDLRSGELTWPWPHQHFLAGLGRRWQLAVGPNFLLAAPTQVPTGFKLSLLLCRPSDGRLIQRFMLDTPQGAQTVVAGQDFALAATSNELWAVARD